MEKTEEKEKRGNEMEHVNANTLDVYYRLLQRDESRVDFSV